VEKQEPVLDGEGRGDRHDAHAFRNFRAGAGRNQGAVRIPDQENAPGGRRRRRKELPGQQSLGDPLDLLPLSVATSDLRPTKVKPCRCETVGSCGELQVLERAVSVKPKESSRKLLEVVRKHIPNSLKEQSGSNDDIVVHVSPQDTLKKQPKNANP
jgi:hypothetical protein